MSRANYTDDLDNWAMIKWRGMVASSIRGKRGQSLLRDLLAALDAMPDKALIAEELETSEGDVCALGAAGKLRGIDMSTIDPEEPEQVAAAFNISEPLAREIAYLNDDYGHYGETPEQRWKRMRDWVVEHISAPAPAAPSEEVGG